MMTVQFSNSAFNYSVFSELDKWVGRLHVDSFNKTDALKESTMLAMMTDARN